MKYITWSLGILMSLVVFIMVSGVFLGEKAEVPPAHVGKILTKNGYKPSTVPPSKFRLEACWAYCDRLVLLEVSDKGLAEKFKLFMPKDQLNMEFEVRMTVSVDSTKIDNIFDRIPPENSKIPFHKIYVSKNSVNPYPSHWIF